MQLLSNDYLEAYLNEIPSNLTEILEDMAKKTAFSPADFAYYIQSSATFSSNIEGNSIDIDTYLKNKHFNIKTKPKEMIEIDDLVEAYNFAMQTDLTQKDFLETHKLLSRHILSLKSQRGKLRNQQVGIFSEGRIEYMAVEPELVKTELTKLFADIKTLLETPLSNAESLYYAAFIHLIFEKIHPFMDGNGRAGRLLEKWFLARKIGETAWAIPSEKYYAQNRALYYQNIHIGYNYYTLKIEKSLPFLLLLPPDVPVRSKNWGGASIT